MKALKSERAKALLDDPEIRAAIRRGDYGLKTSIQDLEPATSMAKDRGPFKAVKESDGGGSAWWALYLGGAVVCSSSEWDESFTKWLAGVLNQHLNVSNLTLVNKAATSGDDEDGCLASVHARRHGLAVTDEWKRGFNMASNRLMEMYAHCEGLGEENSALIERVRKLEEAAKC